MIKVYKLADGENYELLFAIDEETAEVYGDSQTAKAIEGKIRWIEQNGDDPTQKENMEKFKKLITKKYNNGHYITRYD